MNVGWDPPLLQRRARLALDGAAGLQQVVDGALDMGRSGEAEGAVHHHKGGISWENTRNISGIYPLVICYIAIGNGHL